MGFSLTRNRTHPSVPCTEEPLPASVSELPSSVDCAKRCHGLSKNAVNVTAPGFDAFTLTTITSSASDANASRENVTPSTQYSVRTTASSSESDLR